MKCDKCGCELTQNNLIPLARIYPTRDIIYIICPNAECAYKNAWRLTMNSRLRDSKERIFVK